MRVDVLGNRLDQDEVVEIEVDESVSVYFDRTEPEVATLAVDGTEINLDYKDVENLIKGLQLVNSQYLVSGE